MRSLLSLSPPPQGEPNEISHFSISGTTLPPGGEPVWGKYGFVFVRFRDQGSLFLTMVSKQLYSHINLNPTIPKRFLNKLTVSGLKDSYLELFAKKKSTENLSLSSVVKE